MHETHTYLGDELRAKDVGEGRLPRGSAHGARPRPEPGEVGEVQPLHAVPGRRRRPAVQPGAGGDAGGGESCVGGHCAAPLPSAAGWDRMGGHQTGTEPGGGAAYLCAVRSTSREKTTTGAWPRERGGAVFTACACGRGAAGRGDKAIACAAATRSGGRYPMCGGLRARRHAVRRCCWLLSFLSANLFFFYCHFDLIDRDDARLLFFL